MSDKRILLVDDEPDILELIEYNLSKEGYEIETACNGREALEKASTFKPHLILLDVMMPEMDGMETCEIMRKDENLDKTLIAFLTARNEDYSQIAGFNAGADDYIAKPIKPSVLSSRVKALLRRERVSSDSETNTVGDIVIDKDRYLVLKEGVKLNFPKKEFELLALLMSKPGKVFTRDHIMTSVWGSEVIVGDRTIDVHIRKLREKLGDLVIKTVKGVGYKFEDS